jgi:hypothetical protein
MSKSMIYKTPKKRNMNNTHKKSSPATPIITRQIVLIPCPNADLTSYCSGSGRDVILNIAAKAKLEPVGSCLRNQAGNLCFMMF